MEHVTGEVGRVLGGLWGSAVSQGKMIGLKLAEQRDEATQEQSTGEKGLPQKRYDGELSSVLQIAIVCIQV